MSGELKSVLEDGPIEGEPLVSVCVITYNHGKYIRQCLDRILMQKVNFPYEILIHDDASPDDTADIIREYWEKYPTVIKPILQTENQYSQGRSASKFNYDRAKAKYIALCEGDDYWTDEGKLQMQVDFLEEHGEYIACVHRVTAINEFGDVDSRWLFGRYYNNKDFTIKDAENFLYTYGCAGHLSSLVYRNIFLTLSDSDRTEYYSCKCNGDTKLFLLLSGYAPIRRFDDAMSVYRHITTGGTSWSATKAKEITVQNRIEWFTNLSKLSCLLFGTRLGYHRYKFHLLFWEILRYIKHPSKMTRETVKYCYNSTRLHPGWIYYLMDEIKYFMQINRWARK